MTSRVGAVSWDVLSSERGIESIIVMVEAVFDGAPLDRIIERVTEKAVPDMYKEAKATTHVMATTTAHR